MAEDTYDLHAIVCPYCGHEHGDPWEITQNDDDDHEMDCSSCRRPFVCRSSTLVAYIAEPLPETQALQRAGADHG